MNSDEFERGNVYPEYVVDEQGYKHYLARKLGQGGQGAVFSTKDKNVVIKIALNSNTGEIIIDKNSYKTFKDNIDEVRILPLPKGMHIAKPIILLKEPYNGYVMRLLTDMVPIRKLIIPNEDSIASFYQKTGGLRRRLQLLKKISRELLRLNALSIVYADISPENIFISSDIDAVEAWFIDADNMRYTIDFSKTIKTMGYGAPEVVIGKNSNNTLSDIYSFATIAFEVLTLVSPFDGVLLTNDDNWDDEWDDDCDKYAKAERGEIPWIEDEDDDSNYSESGIPREIVLSNQLKNLFQRTFGKEGRTNPICRPSMSEWYKVISQAEAATIECKKCSSTFYIGTNICPFCNEERHRVYHAKIYDYYDIKDIIDDLNKDSEIKIESSDINPYSYIAFRIIDIDGKNDYLLANEIDDILIENEDFHGIEIGKNIETIFIKNLLNRTIKIIDGNKEIRVIPNEKYDFYDLEKVMIRIPINERKERRIYFKLL